MKPTGLSERQIDGLLYAVRKGAITRKDYTEIAGVSPVTASRDLAELANRGLLRAVGARRNRRYIFVPLEEAQQAKLL